MILIVRIGIGHAGEEVLIGLSGQQIAVGQGFLAEIGEACVAIGIGDNRETTIIDLLAVGLGRILHRGRHRADQRLARLGGDQRVGAGISRFHRHSLFITRARAGFEFIGHIAVYRVIGHVFARLEIHCQPPLCPPNRVYGTRGHVPILFYTGGSTDLPTGCPLSGRADRSVDPLCGARRTLKPERIRPLCPLAGRREIHQGLGVRFAPNH